MKSQLHTFNVIPCYLEWQMTSVLDNGFHNSCLIRRIQQKLSLQKIQRLDQGLNLDHLLSSQSP